jgi:SAM-dependent methyltransferase
MIKSIDQQKWNHRYSEEPDLRETEPSDLLRQVLRVKAPEGPVLELACGISGNALALAEMGRKVLAVDISDVALGYLSAEAEKRGTSERISCVQADLATWRPPRSQCYALVISVMFWDPVVFDYASRAVDQEGVLAWQAFAAGQVRYRPSIRPEICLGSGEPASMLTKEYRVIHEQDVDDGHRVYRQMIARRGRDHV